MQKEHLTPVAILIGSAVVGAGLYFGLKAQQPAAPEPAPPAPPPARADTAAPPAQAAPPAAPPMPGGVPGLGPPAAPPEIRQRVEKEVLAQLEARRAELVKKCWEPSFKKNADPPKAKYVFNVSFDPTGKEIARGISEVRGMERADTGQCLREQPLGFTAGAPGVYVGVEVEFILP